MDDKTLQALTALANKLGTTAEYLWGVLLKQAPLTGAMSLMMMTAWIVVCVLLVRYVRSKTRGTDPEWDDEMVRIFSRIGVGLVCAVLAMVITLELGNAVNAIVNPEYWALRQILRR